MKHHSRLHTLTSSTQSIESSEHKPTHLRVPAYDKEMSSRRSSKTASKLRKKAASLTSNDESKKHQGLLPNIHTHCPSLLEYDKCHNSSVPCCNALRDIVTDIFPDVVALQEGKSENVNGNKIRASSSFVSSGRRTSPIQKETDDDNACLKINCDLISCQNRLDESSLFSKVVRKYLLQDRLDRINQTDSPIQNNSTQPQSALDRASGTAAAVVTGGENDAAASGNVKKKRKKKKKKSKSFLANETSSSSPDMHSLLPTETTAAIPQGPKDTSDANHPAASSKPQQLHNSDTTTSSKHHKIDQMLDQSNNAANITSSPKNRDLFSLFSYIQNTVNKDVIGSKEIHHKSKFTKISQSLDKRSMRPIPITEISAMVDKITCRHCENACNDYIKELSIPKEMKGGAGNPNFSSPLEVKWGAPNVDLLPRSDSSISATTREISNSEGKMTVLGTIKLDGSSVEREIRVPGLSPVTNQFGLGTSDNSKSAFDYVSMEEGGMHSQNVGKENSSLDISATDNGIRIELVQQQGTLAKYFQLGFENEGNTFTIQDFDCLMKEVIIPCGMKEIAFEMTEEDLKKISEQTMTLFGETLQLVRIGLPRILKDAQKALADAKEWLKTLDPFNVKAVKALNECGAKQVEYMDTYREMLMKLDRRTLSLRAAKHEHQRWSDVLMEKLWDNYMESSISLVEPSLQYLWKGIQLVSNRTGSVPLHCNSPQQRENLKAVMENRNIVLARLQDKIELVLLSIPTDGSSSTPHLKRLVTFGRYFALKEKSEGKIDDLATGVDSMLKLRDELIFKIIYQTDVSTILNMQSSRCMELYAHTTHVYELVNDLLKSAGMNQKDRITWQTNSIMIEENQMSIDDYLGQEGEASLERQLSEVEHLWHFVKSVLQQCRFFRLIEATKFISNNDVSHVIPPQVFELCEGDVPLPCCRKGFGKKRIVGILSACIYSWLQERCMEWHADLTHQELMIETEEELLKESEDIVAAEQKLKSKKKKKRKQIKKSVSKEMKEIISNHSEVVPKAEKVNIMGEDENLILSTNLPGNGYISNDPVSLEDSESRSLDSSASLDQNMASTTSSNRNGIDGVSKSPRTEKEVVQVCVVDKGKTISAENFLCERYFQALKDDDAYHYK